MIAFYLPDDLTNKTVLELGGYDGDACNLCFKRGAVSATMIDNEEWRQYGWRGPDEAFWQASSIRYVKADLHDWHEPADLVICSNVIYHVRDPFKCLAHLRTLTNWKMILRTSIGRGDQEDVEGPDGWVWYPDGMGHPNGTVWCRPTPGGLRASLRKAGFTSLVEQGSDQDSLVYECS